MLNSRLKSNLNFSKKITEKVNLNVKKKQNMYIIPNIYDTNNMIVEETYNKIYKMIIPIII